MSDMIERVAMALKKAAPFSYTQDEVSMMPVTDYRSLAVAAIAAMLEPTEDVMRAVKEKHGYSDASIYRPFIAAALEGT